MKFGIVFLLFASISVSSIARAEQISIICKTEDTKEFIDIVAKSERTNDVLVQFNGGKFFDGFSSFEDPIFKVIIPFDDGTALIAYNVETQKGGVITTLSKDRQFHKLECAFR